MSTTSRSPSGMRTRLRSATNCRALPVSSRKTFTRSESGGDWLRRRSISFRHGAEGSIFFASATISASTSSTRCNP